MRMRGAWGCLAAVWALALASPASAAGKTGAWESWSQPELDADGDVRIVVMYRADLPAEAVLSRPGRSPQVRVRRAFGRLKGEVVKVRPERLAETVADLEADPDVLFAEPDRQNQSVFAQAVPWGITRIHADPVSRGRRTGAGVRVAVIDTGIWSSATTGSVHPDLAAVYRGGYDFVNDDPFPWDGHGHGTHVAGIIAAVDNLVGVVGAAPRVSLYALKVIGDNGKGTLSDFISALDWCVANGIRVANYSAGGIDRSPTIEEACKRARAAGVTIVAAAGNGGGGLLVPAVFPSVIAVGATDRANARPFWSNVGNDLDLVAPGVNVRSTYVGGGYYVMDGTSMSAPHVAGAAALLISRGISYPDIVEEYLEATATDLETGGPDPYTGHGLVNAARGLPARPTIVAPAARATLRGGTTYRIDWNPVPGAASYRVLYSRSPSGTWKQIVAATQATARLWRVPAVTSTLAGWRVQVAAYDSFGHLIGVNTVRSLAVRP